MVLIVSDRAIKNYEESSMRKKRYHNFNYLVEFRKEHLQRETFKKTSCKPESDEVKLARRIMNLLQKFYFIKTHFLFILIWNCAFLQKPMKIKPLEFDYQTISENYFGKNEKPFPLTVQSGINFQASTTEDGRFLVYTTDKESNFDIHLRDLTTSVSAPITVHPAAEYKPSISPNGKYLAYVSEEFDSQGDIVLVEFNPSEWIERHLRGKSNELDNPIFITNPNYKNLSKRDRWKDQEPKFSPDGNKLVFVSERFTPGKLNLVIYELQTKKMYPITFNGGTSPCFSKNGEEIFYISNKDHPNGEIYLLNLKTNSEQRITNDEYLDFSVSSSSNQKEIYYISIRKDTNANGKLDVHDNSFIVKLNLETKQEYLLTSGKDSILEVEYSNFNGGSLFHSLSLFNSVNIFFIPQSGAIPKRESIQEQFEQARQIQKEHSREYFLLALDSVRIFFDTHPLYPIYKARVLDINLEDLYFKKEIKEFQNLLKTQKSNIETTLGAYFEQAIYEKWKNYKQNSKQILAYEKLSKLIPKEENFKEEICSIYELKADSLRENRELQNAISSYKSILELCPNYHNKEKIYLETIKLTYSNPTQIPEILLKTLEDPQVRIATKREILNFTANQIQSRRNPREARKLAEELKATYGRHSSRLSDLLDYVIAETYFQEKNYIQSNKVLDSYLKPVPQQDPECWNKPGCKRIEICQNDPTCLKGHVLKSKNFDALGEKESSFSEIKVFLENYDPILGVELPESEIEKTFRYFENAALVHYSMGNLQQAAFNFFYNTENIYLLKEKNLYVNTLYKKYAVYYYKKTVDTVISLALQEAQKSRESFLNQINILSKDKLDIFGKISSVFDIALKTRVTKNLKILGDFKDLDRQLILGEKAVALMESYHFKSARPRARKVLYLAALYGYAYYLANKAYVLDSFHIENETMTASRKEQILELLKTAEYELKWIIFAEPQYYEAYQLLGWIYQYVDVSRHQKLSDSEETQEDLYFEAYEKFFSRKYLEENISLYEQILIFLGDYPNKKVLSDLHINLANNYMILNNYNKALENFEKVENLLRDINPDVQFENYKQRSLFEYNYARTLLYQNRFEEAILHFKNALNVIQNNEFIKHGISGVQEKEETRETLSYKKALLHALIGLSYLESNQFHNAIFHIEQTISLNYDFEFFQKAPLFNYLAYCYLKTNQLELAKKYLEIAKKEYQNKKSFRFLFSELLWNLILPEQARIIGESRFPGALPWEFNYLFSLGIEAEIYEKENNIQRLYELFEERKKFISKNNLAKTITGERILTSQFATRGYLSYLQGNFVNAKESYEKAIQNSQDWHKKWKFQLRTSLVFINNKSTKQEGDFLKEFDSLNTFQNSFIEDCTKAVREKQDKEQKKLECKEKFFSNFLEYQLLQGILHYHFAKFYEPQNLSLYFYHLGIALDIFKNIGGVKEEFHFLKLDPLNRIERLELKLLEAKIYLELKEYEKFNFLKNEIKFVLSQIELKEENFYWKVLNNLETAAKLKKKSELKNLEKNHEDLIKNLLSDPYLVYSLPLSWISLELEELEKIYKQNKEYEKIFYLREIYQTIILFKNFFSVALEFEDKDYNFYFQNLRRELLQYFELNLEYRKAIQKRENFIKILERVKVSQKKILQEISKFQKLYPTRSSFLEWSRSSNYSPKENENVIQILNLNSELVVIRKGKNKQIKTYPNIYELEQDKNFFTLRDKKEISLILDYKFNLEDSQKIQKLFYEIYKENLWKVAFRTSQLNSIPNKYKPSFENLIFLESQGSKLESNIYNVDVLVAETESQIEENIFGEERVGKLNLREILQKEQNISLVVVTTKSPLEIWMSWEIFSLARIPSAIFINEVPKFNSSLSNSEFVFSIFQSPNSQRFGLFSLEQTTNPSLREFESHFKKALEYERVREYKQAIYELNQAFANLEPNRIDENSLKADFVDARLKTKLYKDSKEFFFEEVLKKYKENPSFTLKILENILKYCYSYQTFDCNSFYERYTKQALNTQIDLKLRKQSFFIIKHYRYLALGKYNKINKNFFKELPCSEFEDEFLFYKDLISLLQNHFYYIEANYFTEKLQELAKTPKEQQIAQEIDFNLQILIHLSSYGPQKELKLSNIYSSLITKDWKEFFRLLNELSLQASDSLITLYKVKLFTIWKKLEIGEDYNPLELRPEKTISGNSIFYYLDDKDKLLVFYILSKSLNTQNLDAINSIFDELISPSSRTNENLAAYMTIVYAEALFNRPDFVNTEKYIQFFEKNYKEKMIFEDLVDRIDFIKYKFSLFTGKFIYYTDNVKKHDYYKYYESFRLLVSESPANKKKSPPQLDNFYSDFFGMLVEKSKEKFNSRNKRELNDLLYFLQKLAYDKGYTELFLDLVFFRDKINSINERFYDKSFYLNQIGTIMPITKELIAKLPKGQRLEFVVNLGIETFNISYKDQQFTGERIFADNRIIRDKIYSYYRNLQETGSALLEREGLEKNLRDAIVLPKNQKTYLYLSGFWLKNPLELKENDNIYLIQSPEQMVENPILSEKTLFAKNFILKKYLFQTQKNSTLWKELEDIELSSKGGNSNSLVHLIQEPLVFQNLEQIVLGKTPLAFLLESRNKRKGVWILYNSGLYETSFLKDDINSALRLLGYQYIGVGVFSLGPQIQKPANLAFTRELLKQYEFELSLRKRFGNALNLVKTQFREIDWTGYRLYTNCFLED